MLWWVAQMVATVLASFIQVGVKEWIFKNVPDICYPNQISHLTCPHNQVFFTASAVWWVVFFFFFGSCVYYNFFFITTTFRGLIGPTRQFGTGSIYHPHLYALAAGVFIPMPAYFWQRRYPTSWTRYVSTPVIIAGLAAMPPATGINFSSWFLVGFIFQYLIRKKNFAWWSKFNYVLSSAMDSGTVISIMMIFFLLQVINVFFFILLFEMIFFFPAIRVWRQLEKWGGGVMKSLKGVSYRFFSGLSFLDMWNWWLCGCC